jgi:hypothetical protein
MKHVTKFLLTGTFAVAAIALSAAPSEAAKRKAKASSCTPGWTCTAPGSNAGWNKVMACGGDGKWYPALFTPYCAMPFCPPRCG